MFFPSTRADSVSFTPAEKAQLQAGSITSNFPLADAAAQTCQSTPPLHPSSLPFFGCFFFPSSLASAWKFLSFIQRERKKQNLVSLWGYKRIAWKNASSSVINKIFSCQHIYLLSSTCYWLRTLADYPKELWPQFIEGGIRDCMTKIFRKFSAGLYKPHNPPPQKKGGEEEEAPPPKKLKKWNRLFTVVLQISEHESEHFKF